MIILYGGSFSPITYGHYLVIVNIMKQYPDAKMIISPVNQNYSKSLLPYVDRLKMVQLTIDWIKKDYPTFKINASDFMGRGTNPYNDAEWIKYVLINTNDKDIYYLIGTDVDPSTWRIEDQKELNKIKLLKYSRTNGISSYQTEQIYVNTGNLINLIPPVKDYFEKKFSREYIRSLIV